MTLEALAPRQQRELEQGPLLRACCIPPLTCKWSCFYFKPFPSWGELPLIGTADPEWEKESFLKDFCWQETLRLIYSSVPIPLIWLMIHGLPTDGVCCRCRATWRCLLAEAETLWKVCLWRRAFQSHLLSVLFVFYFIPAPTPWPISLFEFYIYWKHMNRNETLRVTQQQRESSPSLRKKEFSRGAGSGVCEQCDVSSQKAGCWV